MTQLNPHNPTTNNDQAMELLEKYEVSLNRDFIDGIGECWVAETLQHPDHDGVPLGDSAATNPREAIVKAAIAYLEIER